MKISAANEQEKELLDPKISRKYPFASYCNFNFAANRDAK